jgi:hypothetical protein
VRILGVAAEAEVSTMLRGRRLLVELDRRRRIDAYDRQLAGRRSTGVQVEIDVISPGIRCAGGSPAMQDAAGEDGAGWHAERWGERGAGGRRCGCPGHDGCRERTRTMVEIILPWAESNGSLRRVASLGNWPVPYGGEVIKSGRQPYTCQCKGQNNPGPRLQIRHATFFVTLLVRWPCVHGNEVHLTCNGH